jgi:hypothetical protein
MFGLIQQLSIRLSPRGARPHITMCMCMHMHMHMYMSETTATFLTKHELSSYTAAFDEHGWDSLPSSLLAPRAPGDISDDNLKQHARHRRGDEERPRRTSADCAAECRLQPSPPPPPPPSPPSPSPLPLRPRRRPAAGPAAEPAAEPATEPAVMPTTEPAANPAAAVRLYSAVQRGGRGAQRRLHQLPPVSPCLCLRLREERAPFRNAYNTHDVKYYADQAAPCDDHSQTYRLILRAPSRPKRCLAARSCLAIMGHLPRVVFYY